MAIIQHGAIRIDVQANTQGVKTMRTDLASLTRLVNQSATQHEKFEKVLEKIAAVQKEGLRDSQFTSQAVVAAANNFVQAEKAAGRYGEALEYISERIPELSGEMQRLRQAMIQEADLERARKAALAEQELKEKLYREQEHRDRQASALSKKLDKEAAQAKVEAEKRALEQIKALQKQADDVEAYFDAQGRKRAEEYTQFVAEQEQKRANLRKQFASARAGMGIEKEDDKIESDYQTLARNRRTRNQKDLADAKSHADARIKAEKDAQKQLRDVEEYFERQATRSRSQYAARRAKIDEAEARRVAMLRKKEEDYAKRVLASLEKEALAKERAQRRVNKVLQEGLSPVERLTQKLERFRMELDKGRISEEQFIAVQKRLNAEIAKQNMPTAVKEEGKLAGFATGALSGLSPTGALTAGAAGFMIGSKTLDFAKDSVVAYMDLRDALIKLEVVLGSSSKAMRTFGELRQMAVRTNQTSDAMMRAAVTMAQFGVSGENLTPVMRRLSEISAGNAERLQSLAIAYGQVAAAGRLTGQETLQFVNAGFSPLAEIARTTGKSMADLRKEMENGQITVDMVTQSLVSATEAGGRFFGMADKLSEELSGKLNRLNNEFTILKEQTGEMFAKGGLADGISETSSALKSFNEELARMNKFNVSFMGSEIITDFRGLQANYNMFLDAVAQGSTQADIERMTAEAEAVQKAQELMAQTIADAVSAAPSAIEQAGQAYADALKQFEGMARQGADLVQKNDIKQRAEAQKNRIKDLLQLKEERDRLLEDKKPTDISGAVSDLPKAISMGTREAYELINRTQSTMQAKQLEEQRKQRMAQDLTNKLLSEAKKNNLMGILN